MKLELLTENLNKALGLVSRIIPNKSTVQVLNNILISAQNGKILIEAAGLDMGMKITVGGKIISDGGFTVPARVFTEIVASLSADRVELEKVAGHLVVRSGKFNGKINGVEVSEWPSGPEFDANGSLEIESSLFIAAAGRVVWAAATDDNRPILTGVLFQTTDIGVNLVATDGFRLSRDVVKAEGKLPSDLVIPVRAVGEMARMIKANEKVVLSFSRSTVRTEFEDGYLWARVLEGNFPPYEKIIPSNQLIKVRCDREELLKAVKTAGIFGRENSNIVKLVMSKDDLLVSGQSAQVGENSTMVDIESSGISEQMTIAFNSKYLTDVLGGVESREVVMGIKDHLTAVTFGFESLPEFTHLVMPIMTTG
jgi:DNA polymerase-3 subunit beta